MSLAALPSTVLRHRLKNGFTLLELLAVLVIMGLLTTAAVVSLRRARPPETSEQLAARFLDFTESVRDRAEVERQPWVVDIRPGADELTAHPDGQAQPTRNFAWPKGWALIAARGGAVEWSGSRVLWPCDVRGQGPSFALELRDAAGEYRYLLQSGLSGQQLAPKRKEDADAWFPRVHTP